MSGAEHNDRRHRAALLADRDRLVAAAVDWFAETARYVEAGELTWDDLSDPERALFRAAEKHEQRKAGRR